MQELLLNAGTDYIITFLDKIIASNSLGLLFSVAVNVMLFKGYKSEKDYNRERDSAVTKIIALMQSRLEDLKGLQNVVHNIKDNQAKQSFILEQLNANYNKQKDD